MKLKTKSIFNNGKGNSVSMLFFLLILSFVFVSCGDADTLLSASIKNNTNLEVVVQFSDNSIVVCPPKQEKIIEETIHSYAKELFCTAPYVFRNDMARVIVDGGSKILMKDVSDDNNWDCYGDKVWSLITVGSYYNEIMTTFVIDNEDIKEVE